MKSLARHALALGTASFLALGCTEVSPGGSGDAGSGDAAGGSDASGQVGCLPNEPCYTVFAHSDDVLYHIDLANKSLVEIGPFETPGSDVITDLAVAPDDQLWGVSETSVLYSIDRVSGNATEVASLATCGDFAVALTYTADGRLLAGDFSGSICRIETSTSPPQVNVIGQLGDDLALAGDMVAVGDGTLFGTAYDLTQAGTQSDNILVTIDPDSGQATPVGASGFPSLYGVAFEQEEVFGFTHDGTGRVVTLDPVTGEGTLYGTFTRPGTTTPIAFAGAAVNPNVPPVVE